MGDKREMASSARLLGQIDKRLAATYADLVRYTWIGALLNVRKPRTAVK